MFLSSCVVQKRVRRCQQKKSSSKTSHSSLSKLRNTPAALHSLFTVWVVDQVFPTLLQIQAEPQCNTYVSLFSCVHWLTVTLCKSSRQTCAVDVVLSKSGAETSWPELFLLFFKKFFPNLNMTCRPTRATFASLDIRRSQMRLCNTAT